jgi:glycosyltransferase involved in cell wall biosynthesis
MIEGPPDEAPALGHGGEIVPLSSPMAAARAMERLLTDPDWWGRCSRAIKERTLRYYNKTRIDRIYNELYTDLMARPDAPPPGLDDAIAHEHSRRAD